MTSATKEQRIAQLEGYAKTLVQALRVMDERRHILQPLLRDAEIAAALANKFRNTFGAHAYNHLVPMMAQDLVRDLARLFMDDDRRAASFVNVYRKAAEPSLHRELRRRFREIPDKWHDQPGPIPGLPEEQSDQVREQWRDRDRQEFEASFDEGWTLVTAAVKALETDVVGQKIKTFRDKFHAHLEMAPLGADPGPFDVSSLGLTFNDLLDFADRYMEPAFELMQVITGSVHNVQDSRRFIVGTVLTCGVSWPA
ncbi:MAG TPA: hypothetical protein VF329_01900 [Gammaproteobacteria bacterium]